MVKFSGDFKELKPMGFRFQKLYAHNYKAYIKDEEDMLIWVAGRDIIFNNIRSKYLEKVFKMIIDDTYPIYERTYYWKDRKGNDTDQVFFEKGSPRMCIVDKETDEIMSHDAFMRKWKIVYPDVHDYMEFAHSGRFSDLILHKRHIKLVKTMVERRMFSWERN